MPIYLFENNKTGKIVEIFQSSHEPHVYNGKSGDETGLWDRVFCIPGLIGAGTVSNIDPFDEKAYTNNMAGRQKWTIEDATRASKELSEKRAEKNGGIDPVKEAAAKEYKERVGKESFTKIREDGAKKLKEKFGFEYKRPKDTKKKQ
jgi:hypothetical protein